MRQPKKRKPKQHADRSRSRQKLHKSLETGPVQTSDERITPTAKAKSVLGAKYKYRTKLEKLENEIPTSLPFQQPESPCPCDIVPVKTKGPKPIRPNWHPNLPEPPFTMIMVAPRKSGKTTCLSNMVSRLLFHFDKTGRKRHPYFHHIKMCSPSMKEDPSAQPMLPYVDEYRKHWDESIVDDVVELHDMLKEDFPNEFKLKGPNQLLILDDCMRHIPNNPLRPSKLSDFSIENRHKNCSIIHVIHNFRGISTVFREQTSTWLFFFIPQDDELLKITEAIPHFMYYYKIAVKGEDRETRPFLVVHVEGGQMTFLKRFDEVLGVH